jgi:hypothetical protein
VQQIVSVGAQRLVRQAANVLAVQETIDPANLATAGLLDNANRALSIAGCGRVNQMELHG